MRCEGILAGCSTIRVEARLVFYERFERLGHSGGARQRVARDLVPLFGKALHVARADDAPAAGHAAAAGQICLKVAEAVVGGDLLARANVAHQDLNFWTHGEAGRLARVIDVPTAIPAKNMNARRIQVAVLLQELLVGRCKRGNLVHRVASIEAAQCPYDGAPGQLPGREDPVSEIVVYIPKFCLRMNHAGSAALAAAIRCSGANSSRLARWSRILSRRARTEGAFSSSCPNSSRLSVRNTQSVSVRTVAVRRTALSSAISPKWSPSRSTAICVAFWSGSFFTTSTSPRTMM